MSEGLTSADPHIHICLRRPDGRKRFVEVYPMPHGNSPINTTSWIHRSALPSDPAANSAEVRTRRRIAFMNPRGGSCPLRTSMGPRGGTLRRPSAAARTESLHRRTSTIASRGSTITLGMLGIRAIALNGQSWALRSARISTRLSLRKGSPLRVDLYWSGNPRTMSKHFLSQAWNVFGSWRLMSLYLT